jgi:hypothetical protein
VGVSNVPKKKWDVEYAYIRHKIWKRRASDESQIDRAELHGLQHFHLAAQRGVRKLLDPVSPLRPFRDFVSEDTGAGA